MAHKDLPMDKLLKKQKAYSLATKISVLTALGSNILGFVTIFGIPFASLFTKEIPNAVVATAFFSLPTILLAAIPTSLVLRRKKEALDREVAKRNGVAYKEQPIATIGNLEIG
ncbi:MAG: hypothetical protein J6A28_00355 [Clostridia bacterium]|nr:hypothetical protein [Clostridia bacterium]